MFGPSRSSGHHPEVNLRSYGFAVKRGRATRFFLAYRTTLLSKTPFNFHVEGKVYLDRDRGEVWRLPAADFRHFRHIEVPIAPIAVQLAQPPACRRR